MVAVAEGPMAEVVRAVEQREVGAVKVMAADGQVELAIRPEVGGVMRQLVAAKSKLGERFP